MGRRRRSGWTRFRHDMAPHRVAWRVMFGHNGPTKAAMRRAWRDWTGPKEIASAHRDPATGKVRTKGLVRAKNGTWDYKPSKAAAKKTAKRRVAEKDARNLAATIRQVERMAYQAPKPMSQRVQRSADGTFNGSTPAATAPRPARQPTYADAQRAYQRALREAAAADGRASDMLGW